MYTKRIYSPWIMLRWTRLEILRFLLIAAIPVVVYDVFGQRWVHLPWLPIALVGTAVAFILGFQNNVTYGRIWEARKIWGGIVNASRAWALMVNDFVTNDFAETPAEQSELHEIRRSLIYRHIAWLTALRHAMRQPRPWEVFSLHRTNREWSDRMQVHEHRISLEEDLTDYLPESERGRVCGRANVPAQILGAQSAHLRELRTRGLIEDFRHMEFQQALNGLLDLQGKSERIKNFPYPRQYATLNSIFVAIFVHVLPFGLVHEFHKLGEEINPDYPAIGPWFVWAAVPFSAVVMWIFHVMERIGQVGENPFEGSANDIPITTMSRAIEIDMRQLLGESSDAIPAPIEPKHGCQM